MERGEPLPVVGLAGGDLCRTLGGTGDRRRLTSSAAHQFPVDIAVAEIDGIRRWFVAHLVARRSWWFGPIWIAANAESYGDWDLAPRAHPGDGQLDILSGALPWRDRVSARRRLRTGTHVPHPGISQHRAAQIAVDFERALPVECDGVYVGRARRLDVTVVPAALTVVV